jgi:chromosome segregation ATPase
LSSTERRVLTARKASLRKERAKSTEEIPKGSMPSTSRRDAIRKSVSKRRLVSKEPESDGEGNGLRRKSSMEPLKSEKKSPTSMKKSMKDMNGNTHGESTDTFDRLWVSPIQSPTAFAGLGKFMKTQPRRSDNSDNQSVASRDSLLSIDYSLPSDLKPNVRKTKLEKIHELQAKCDRYKKEWIDVTKDKKQYRKEVQLKKLEVISMTQEIDTHMLETEILRRNLSDALQKLDETQEVQRQERGEYSNAAKELAQSRIDHARSLNDARELRAEFDQLEKNLGARDRRISTLLEDFKISKEKAEDLDAVLNQAENEILKLEDEIQRIEKELITYRAAADKDDSDGNNENLRKVRDDMEQRMHEEREKRVEQKQQKLDDKVRQFEEERALYLEKEKEKELELAEQRRQEEEKQKEREEERHRRDDEINQRLKQLEDDNTVLQGRLKSEQLETRVKLQKKDDALGKLQRELAEVKKQLGARDSDPNGLLSLQQEVEAVKVESATAKEDLEEAQKHNGMLEEEIEDLQSGTSELRTDMGILQKDLITLKKDSDNWKRKAEESQAKSGELSDKAFLWKEKAEMWENTARELDADAVGESISNAPAKADPQALFLQAAFEKKRAGLTRENSRWHVIGGLFNKASDDGNTGGLFNKASEDGDESDSRVQELEQENTKQLATIKNLRSEMVKVQTTFKEEAYGNQQKMQNLQKEREAIELKNTNLMKELELARKLASIAAQDI